jgi:hypothetical protein
VLLGWRVVVATRAARGEQLHLLDRFLPIVANAQVAAGELGYPAIRGSLDGHPVRLELIPDTLGFRALPVLWLEVRWKRSHAGRLLLIRQRTGTEYFDDDSRLSRRLEINGWPVATEVWGEAGGQNLLSRIQTIDPADFPSIKRILVQENELRVTLRCDRGDAPAYRVLRRAKFPSAAASDALVAETVKLLRAVEHALSQVAASA